MGKSIYSVHCLFLPQFSFLWSPAHALRSIFAVPASHGIWRIPVMAEQNVFLHQASVFWRTDYRYGYRPKGWLLSKRAVARFRKTWTASLKRMSRIDFVQVLCVVVYGLGISCYRGDLQLRYFGSFEVQGNWLIRCRKASTLADIFRNHEGLHKCEILTRIIVADQTNIFFFNTSVKLTLVCVWWPFATCKRFVVFKENQSKPYKK